MTNNSWYTVKPIQRKSNIGHKESNSLYSQRCYFLMDQSKNQEIVKWYFQVDKGNIYILTNCTPLRMGVA